MITMLLCSWFMMYLRWWVLQYTTIKPSDDDVALKMRNLLFIDFSLSLCQQGLGFWRQRVVSTARWLVSMHVSGESGGEGVLDTR
jgi:hypothetical protein